MMHTYCSQCSECLEYCPHATDPSALEIVHAQLKATRADYHALVLENVTLSEQVAFWRSEARRRSTAAQCALLLQLADEASDSDTAQWLREKAEGL